MGYCHYWRRKKEYDLSTFSKAVRDIQTVFAELKKMGLDIAGGNGNGNPIIEPRGLNFNGVEKCGHIKHDFGITWPSDKSGGFIKSENNPKSALAVKTWFAGNQLDSRQCGGDCSHENFVFGRALKKAEPDPKTGLIFDAVKTAYKPYDIAVNCALIILKNHLKTDIIVSSDGELKNWFDAMLLCHINLGYGLGFKLEK